MTPSSKGKPAATPGLLSNGRTAWVQIIKCRAWRHSPPPTHWDHHVTAAPTEALSSTSPIWSHPPAKLKYSESRSGEIAR